MRCSITGAAAASGSNGATGLKDGLGGLAFFGLAALAHCACTTKLDSSATCDCGHRHLCSFASTQPGGARPTISHSSVSAFALVLTISIASMMWQRPVQTLPPHPLSSHHALTSTTWRRLRRRRPRRRSLLARASSGAVRLRHGRTALAWRKRLSRPRADRVTRTVPRGGERAGERASLLERRDAAPL